MSGIRNPKNNLWKVPLTTSEGELSNHHNNTTYEGENENVEIVTNNLYQLNKLKDVMQYLHACLFSPKLQTITQAVKNNNLITFPGMNIKNVSKYMKETIATAKGHLDRNRKNVRSTKTKAQADHLQEIKYYKDEEEDKIITPKREEKTNEIFVSYLAQDINGVIYTDLTGKLPVTSINGNKYILLLYCYDVNAILVRPLKNRSDKETLNVYQAMYEELETK